MSTIDLAAAHRRTPIHEQTSLLDEEFWDTCEVRAHEQRARVALSTVEVKSYFAALGQSSREDYHRAFADLYGMQPVHEGYTDAWTSFDALAYLVNRLENVNEGLTQTMTLAKTLTWEPMTHLVGAPEPVKVTNEKIRAVSCAFSAFFGLGPCPTLIRPVPEHRTHLLKGVRVCTRMREVTHQRPATVTYTTVETPLPPAWTNPCQIEDGFTILAESTHTNFRRPGVEGLSVVVDKAERLHLVYWITERFSFLAKGRDGKTYRNSGQGKNPPKMPLAVCSFAMGIDPDEALAEMAKVAAGMARTVREGREAEVPGWIAAELDDLRPMQTSAPDITGSHAWLTAIDNQRETGETYRPHGATSDD